MIDAEIGSSSTATHRSIGMRASICLLVSLMSSAGCAPQSRIVDGSIPPSSGEQTATVDGQSFRVFTFRPTGCEIAGILVVFHGVDRNADVYRDDAIPIAQRYCLLTIAPLFEQERFPGWRYQRGGVVHADRLQPEVDWTTGLVPGFVAWAQSRAGRPDLPYMLIGHSAGAQFLSRVAAYQPGSARRFVIANPSTWVRPRLDIAAPYGFGPPFPLAKAEPALRRYLALPITVLLGADDTGSRNLSDTEEAEAQGATRVERGRAVFAEAEQTARTHGWPFNWRLSIVPGTGHNARRMFVAPGAFEALAP